MEIFGFGELFFATNCKIQNRKPFSFNDFSTFLFAIKQGVAIIGIL